MSHSSSFEYTILVHAGVERNVYNIVASTETHQATTNSSQTLLPVYKLALTPAPFQILTLKTHTTFSRCGTDVNTCSVYHLSTCIYVSVHEILSLIACASTQISLRIFKISPELFACSHTLQSMDVDKDKTKF